MRSSECCIVRVSIAAILGFLVALGLLWRTGPLAAVMLSPLFGSAAAVAAVVLFWFVSLFVPCETAATETPDANR